MVSISQTDHVTQPILQSPNFSLPAAGSTREQSRVKLHNVPAYFFNSVCQWGKSQEFVALKLKMLRRMEGNKLKQRPIIVVGGIFSSSLPKIAALHFVQAASHQQELAVPTSVPILHQLLSCRIRTL